MKKTILTIALALFFIGCRAGSLTDNSVVSQEVQVNIDLVNVTADKVLVTIIPPKVTTDETTFSMPKIIPGNYTADNLGRFIDDFKAFDSKGNALEVTKTDDNNWKIKNAKTLAKITYLVNDTFDIEKGTGYGKGDVFSPCGTNILANINFLINTQGFVGYFKDKLDVPYKVTIAHPDSLWGATSMNDEDSSNTIDVFKTARYAVLVENPIMYSKPNYTSFKVNGMDILFAVYSPTGKFTAESISQEVKTMITAQKNFLGNINSTKKYSILLYLSSSTSNDTQSRGALEHPTATTVVYPEALTKEQLVASLIETVSHEFFHIVTPLTIHSKEIQFFDYNDPKMSEHLWMYEGVTEYFSYLFQINQSLIDEAEFCKQIATKIEAAKAYNDSMSFTKMSANVLVEPYNDEFVNFYNKGALIGMCIDIIIREKSNGQRGILDLMHKLSSEYGIQKPFNDNELFAKITELTYPEVGEFLSTYVSGTTPIPYNTYLEKVGVTKSIEKKVGNIFYTERTLFIKIDENSPILVSPDIELNAFFKNLNLKGNDIILSINNKPYSYVNRYDLITDSENWKENDPITVLIKRDGIEQTIKGTVKLPYYDTSTLKATDDSKKALRDAWLKG
nr:peptidase M61 [uncultured Flavobacterium sp.]